MNSEPPLIHQCFRPAFCGMVSIVLQPTLFTVNFLYQNILLKYSYVFNAKYFRALQKQENRGKSDE